MKTAQELFEERKQLMGIRAAQIHNALKYRGMDGMQGKIVELTKTPT